MTALQAGAQQLSDQAPQLTGGIAQLASGAQQLQQQGTAPVRSGVEQLSGGLGQLAAGSQALKQGTGELSAKIPALTDGVGKLKVGTDSLKQGTAQLTAGAAQLQQNSAALNQGAAALKDGAGKIQDGAQKLYDGSLQLGDGILQLKDGSNTLQERLAEGAQQLQETNTSQQTVDMFAAPVQTEETMLTSVPNNGHAMAPYMMSVALWVGCIAFSLMYPLTAYQGELKNGTAWWISKASVLYPLAIAQALVMLFALNKIDGLQPVRMANTVLVACVAAVTFMSVMYFFTCLLGKVGSFLMLIFMVVQLAGSVGTYPLEISGDFVKNLYPWVPFTYTVKAFRSTIAGGESVAGCLQYLAVWLVVFSLLTILVFQIRSRRIKQQKPTLMDWLEHHHLA